MKLVLPLAFCYQFKLPCTFKTVNVTIVITYWSSFKQPFKVRVGHAGPFNKKLH